jgi:glutathione-regulated potassium-efflux system ancillary protein KefC
VGYLGGGLALFGMGATASDLLHEIGHLGVLLLLFTIGLHLRLRAPLNRAVHTLYARLEPILARYERATDHPDDTPRLLGSARSLVFGMGRTGTAAYAALTERGQRPVGLDSDPGKIEQHRNAGLRVIYGDAEDPELWEHLDVDRLDTVILAVPDFEARMHAVKGLRKRGYEGAISTISMFPEEEEPLREAGADLIAHPLTEAGFGLAEQSLKLHTG